MKDDTDALMREAEAIAAPYRDNIRCHGSIPPEMELRARRDMQQGREFMAGSGEAAEPTKQPAKPAPGAWSGAVDRINARLRAARAA